MSITLAAVQQKVLKYENDEQKLLSYLEKLGDKVYDDKKKLKKKFLKVMYNDVLKNNDLLKNKVVKVSALAPRNDVSVKGYGKEFICHLTEHGMDNQTVIEFSKTYDKIVQRWEAYKMNFDCYKIQKFIEEKYQ